MNPIVIVIGAVILFVIFMIFVGSPFALWFQAMISNAKVGLMEIIFMRFRKVPPKLIVEALITAVKAGGRTKDEVKPNLLEAHYLAGGNVLRVVKALVAAAKARIPLSFDMATGIDLAGRDVLEAVQMSVKPKVIDCPHPEKSATGMLDAVAKDGIRLLVKARVTVRANIEKLVGGASEDTIVARVGQGIVSAIGSSKTYKDVLENPDQISRKVLDSGLDAQTAFEIVSIDIADISVASVANVSNVGAVLETERAEADKKMRQAEAEGRRAMAVAMEQEMLARVQEMRARVVEAEAQVPIAMAEAFRSGNLGIMDYYKMKNIVADTQMRDAIGGKPGDEEKKK